MADKIMLLAKKQQWLHELVNEFSSNEKYRMSRTAAEKFVRNGNWDTYIESGTSPKEAAAEDASYWD